MLIIFSCSSDDKVDQGGLNEIAQEFLSAQNRYRAEVGIGNLTWSDDLAASASAWAEELAVNCELVHSSGSHGENLWIGTTNAFTIEDVVDSWGSEKQNYNYAENSCAEGEVCGHYTQIVWENTTEVGCGMVSCDGWDIWVCQYLPAGNIIGQRPY